MHNKSSIVVDQLYAFSYKHETGDRPTMIILWTFSVSLKERRSRIKYRGDG